MLSEYWRDISVEQASLALLVGVREAWYFAVVAAALFRQPVFLLIDMRACWRYRNGDGAHTLRFWVIFFVVSPDKFAFLYCDRNLDDQRFVLIFFWAIAGFLDLCAIAALAMGLNDGNLPLALGISYSVTALGGVAVLCWLVIELWKSRVRSNWRCGATREAR